MMLEFSIFAVLAVGFVLGLKHATDADHVVAVTTFVGEQKSLIRSVWIGFFWGLGHTLALTVAGLLVVVFRLPISEALASRLELLVAGMLILLGVRVILQWSRERFHLHKHAHVHEAQPHTQPHAHWHLHSTRNQERHSGWLHFGFRPFVVGIVHGAAGSAALMLLVLSTIPRSWSAILYIIVFGAGSILGMLLISLLLAAPLQWARSSSTAIFKNIQLAAGVASCGFGMYLVFTLM